MFLYVLETKVNHQVSENTLLDGAGNRKEKHNTKQCRRNKREKALGAFVQNPPARRQFIPTETFPLCGVHGTRSSRWAEMQILLFPLIQIFKFSNIYAVTIEWQLTSLIFIEDVEATGGS